MGFPIFVGKKGKEIYKEVFARDHSVIHDSKPYAPFKHSTTKATTATTTTEASESAHSCMNVNIDLQFSKTTEQKETVICPSFPTTEEKPESSPKESSTSNANLLKKVVDKHPEDDFATEKQASEEQTTKEPKTEEPKTKEPKSEEPLTETEAAADKSKETTEPDKQTDEDAATATKCPIAPICSEEDTTTSMTTCPAVTGCIRRKKIGHTRPLKLTKSSFKFIPKRATKPTQNIVKNNLDEMRYDDYYYTSAITQRRVLRNSNARPTTSLHTIKDYYYYYYFLK